MAVAAVRAELGHIQPLRALFLQESNFLLRYHSYHERGWTDAYLLQADDCNIGYAAIKGRARDDRDTVFEFFVTAPFRKLAGSFFRELVAVSGARYLECQTNDRPLCALLFEFTGEISGAVVLFEDHTVTGLTVPGAVVRRRGENDQIFAHQVEPVGDYVVERDGEVVATGGFMLHYNPPFADLYMEVREDCRRQDLASFLLQELKKECYLAGRVPAARCQVENAGSRGALSKAGLRECGFILTGTIRL